MPSFNANGTRIHYEQFGARADPPLLLVHGFACQLVHWPKRLIERLVAAELRIIVFDNRDVGLSDQLNGYPAPDIETLLRNPGSAEPLYSLSDMAGDAVALLNHLGQSGAHVVGFSMGGMIGQTLAIEHPERVYSLVSMMATTSQPGLPPGDRTVRDAMWSPPPDDREGAIAHEVRAWKLAGGKHFDSEQAGLARLAATAHDRAFHPAGRARQLLALRSAESRQEALHALTVPALVIHGREDPLIPMAAGEATAEAIPDARLIVLDKVGHDLPEPLLDDIAGHILDHVRATAPVR